MTNIISIVHRGHQIGNKRGLHKDTNTDQLLLGYDTVLWKQKADDVKILCVAQRESEYSPKMQ